jgi:(p)ppGpp synthase/HD superfamily hydrolase
MDSAAFSDKSSVNAWLATARGLATQAHEGQQRRGGTPYLTHPASVAAAVPPFLQPIAWLHDACEDSPLTLEDLRVAGLPDYVVAAVAAISKMDGEDYEAYLARVLANPHAAAVKCADIAHNLSENPKPASREKYLRALPRLLPVAATVWPEVAKVLALPK